MTVQPHAVAAEAATGARRSVERFTPELDEADLVVRVHERVGATTGGVSLAEAKVVVSCGRGAGSPEGFGIIEELAGLLGGAVGCSRAVTMAGWRPHTDQVGQTGTKIAPDIYIACGISGATQHMAGCKGAKAILAVNTDPEAPILASADYAVIGDLHEVVPAISAELRKASEARPELDGERRLRARARRRGRDRRRALRAPRALPHPARPLGQARQPRVGHPDPRPKRDDDRARAAEAPAAARPGPRARVHLLGLRRSLPDDLHGGRRDRRSRAVAPSGSPLGWLESQGWYALLVDLFAVLVLMGVAAAFWIRKVQRPARFEGSHLGEADLILALIAGIVTTLLLWHATLIALGLNPWPADWSPVSDALSGLFGDDTTTEVLERVFVWAHVLIILGFLAYLPHSKHLHIATAAINVFFGADARARPAGAARLRVRGRGGAALRRGHRRRPDVEADARLDVVHRVRPLPGRLSRLRDRQGALAEAPDHGHPRSALRGGTGGTRRRRPLPARPERGHGRGRLGLRDLRRVRARVPGLDRARRPHRRPPPQPRHGRVAASGRDRDDAARRRARLEPVGEAAGGARVVGRGARRPRPRAGRPAARGPVLGRLRRSVRRARPHVPRSRRRSSCSPPGSTSRSSARASRAPAIRRGAPGTSTSSSRSRRRTSRR